MKEEVPKVLPFKLIKKAAPIMWTWDIERKILPFLSREEREDEKRRKAILKVILEHAKKLGW